MDATKGMIGREAIEKMKDGVVILNYARDVLVNKVENKYNEEGLLVEQIGFDSESIITWKAVFNYKNGLKSDVSEYGSDGNLKTKLIYAYNGSNVSEENCYNAEGTLVGKLVYKYEGDRLTVEDEYFADGTLDTEKQYSYTEAGNKDSITTFNGNGEMMLKEVFRYNTENVLTEITTYGADNKVASRTIVKFDDKGNFTKMTTYTVSKKFGTTVNEMSAVESNGTDNPAYVQDATYQMPDGSIYTKYNWAQYVVRDSVHGLMHTNGYYGIWNIPCSAEWYPGGPMKQELTAHATGKSPITIQMLQGEHMGTASMYFNDGERKIYGPFFLYLNFTTTKDQEELIKWNEIIQPAVNHMTLSGRNQILCKEITQKIYYPA